MIKRTLTLLTVLLTFCTGCMQEMMPVFPDGNGNEKENMEGDGTVRFNVRQKAATRSSISIDERQLSDVNIYAYCDGLLYAHAYSTTPETVSLKLKKGTTYNLYAVANTSEMAPLQKESDFIDRFRISLNSIADLGGRNLLAWEHKGFVLSASAAEVNMQMTRLYSKVHFKLDKGVLKGLEVKSVKLCQAASTVYPFHGDGSFAASTGEVMDGDFASAADLAQLNSTGEGIFFYTLENRQGSLLPSNTDPWKKTPDNIAGKENLCTFIEVTASFREGFFYSGTVTYRFYLGQDSTTNFDVIRNNDTSVLLTLSGDNYGEGQQDISWKVILDTGMKREGYANYRIGQHVNPGNRLCVTERFEFLMSLKDEIFNHFDRDMKNFYISAIDPVTEKKTGDIITLTGLQPMSSAPDDNRFRCIGTVHKPGQWKYGLFDSRSDRLVSIIHNEASTSACDEAYRPLLVVGCNPANYHEKDTPAVINGKEAVYYLYAADNSTGTGFLNRKGVFSPGEGNSIDLSQYSGFNFQLELAGPHGPVPGDKNLVFSRYEPVGEDEDVPYVGRIYFRAVNDGITGQDLLIDLLADNSPDPATLADFRMYAKGCSEKFDVVQSESTFPFAIEPIEVTAYNENDSRWESGKSKYGYTLRVRNTSKLPLHIDCMTRVGREDFVKLVNRIEVYDQNTATAPMNGYVIPGLAENPSMALRFISANISVDKCNLPTKQDGEYTDIRLFSGCFTNDAQSCTTVDLDVYFKKKDEMDMARANVSSSGYGYDDIVHMEDTKLRPYGYPDIIMRSGMNSSSKKDHGVIYVEGEKNMSHYKFVTQDEWLGLTRKGNWRIRFDKQGFHLSGLSTPLKMTFESTVGLTRYKEAAAEYIDINFSPSDKSFINYKNGIMLNQDRYDMPQWENTMNKYHTPAYKKEYWHTWIHTKAGHHIVHPAIREVWITRMFFYKSGTPEWGKAVYECPVLEESYQYTRDHIDKDSEKNDDSMYGYTVTVKPLLGTNARQPYLFHCLYMF